MAERRVRDIRSDELAQYQRNFDGKDEAFGSRGGPVADRDSRRSAVEGRVHFDRSKLRSVECEIVGGPHSLRIKAAFPSICSKS